MSQADCRLARGEMTASTTGAYDFYATTDSGFLGESMSVFVPPEVRSTDDALDADQTTKTHAACDECSMLLTRPPLLADHEIDMFTREAQIEMFWRTQWLRALREAEPLLLLLYPETDGTT